MPSLRAPECVVTEGRQRVGLGLRRLRGERASNRLARRLRVADGARVLGRPASGRLVVVEEGTHHDRDDGDGVLLSRALPRRGGLLVLPPPPKGPVPHQVAVVVRAAGREGHRVVAPLLGIEVRGVVVRDDDALRRQRDRAVEEGALHRLVEHLVRAGDGAGEAEGLDDEVGRASAKKGRHLVGVIRPLRAVSERLREDAAREAEQFGEGVGAAGGGAYRCREQQRHADRVEQLVHLWLLPRRHVRAAEAGAARRLAAARPGAGGAHPVHVGCHRLDAGHRVGEGTPVDRPAGEGLWPGAVAVQVEEALEGGGGERARRLQQRRVRRRQEPVQRADGRVDGDLCDEVVPRLLRLPLELGRSHVEQQRGERLEDGLRHPPRARCRGRLDPPPPRRQPCVQVRPRLLARNSAAVLELGDHRRRACDVLAEGFAPGGVVLGAGVEKERQVGRLRQRRPLDQPAVEAAGALAVRVERYLASEAVVADANCVPEHEVAPKVGVEVLAPGRQQRVGPHALLKPLEEELVPIHRQVIGQRRDPHQQHTKQRVAERASQAPHGEPLEQQRAAAAAG
mmetsp:Transcript_20004/g.63868  ORF Transcript_20004/g.63868 Transcript_20004/m.63868 type:complete len:568 (-) Transcript_20004:237-1940(-)